MNKPQLIDVVRAAAKRVGASVGQIEAIGELSEAELNRLVTKLTSTGARVTAHLTKSKSSGYGFITLGFEGTLPPGIYHRINVTGMKDARRVAGELNALMWNF